MTPPNVIPSPGVSAHPTTYRVLSETEARRAVGRHFKDWPVWVDLGGCIQGLTLEGFAEFQRNEAELHA